ncbi:MAG: hypothetical protein RBQ94_00040 [Methanimicrococcus sp.]|nr:hypothetical protein [Methanimicrococcus sp.]
MKVEYISMLKNDGEIISPSESFFKKLFTNVTKNSFIFELDGVEKQIDYSEEIDKDNEMWYLQIEFEEDEEIETAKTLIRICEKIEYGEHRAKYYFIKINDEACEEYYNKIYPLIGKFERTLRKLVYYIVLKAYGKEWPDQTKLENKKNKDNRIQSGLEDFTITELYDFLFEKTPQKDISLEKWQNELNQKSIESKNSDELRELIESIRPTSLWDELFLDIEIEGLEESKKDINDVRNATFHHRTIKLDECNNVEKIIEQLLPQIEQNIDMVKQKSFTLEEQKIIKNKIIIKQLLEEISQQLTLELEKINQNVNTLEFRNLTQKKIEETMQSNDIQKIAQSEDLQKDVQIIRDSIIND